MSKPCACVSTFVRVCGGVSRSLGRARRRRGLRRPEPDPISAGQGAGAGGRRREPAPPPSLRKNRACVAKRSRCSLCHTKAPNRKVFRSRQQGQNTCPDGSHMLPDATPRR
jgi:hypothetical protein